MWFSGMLKRPDINAGVENFIKTPGALLIDVRTEQEYWDTHIMGSVNIPLGRIDEIKEMVQNKNKPIFIYCQSGGRSQSAVAWLKNEGYTNVNDIGGIAYYHGKQKTKSQF